eukprot:m.5525 g.5525  ORF g.5525 m.5525 type:complete len:86 (+) comp2521_c0_seq1:273-530(+)
MAHNAFCLVLLWSTSFSSSQDSVPLVTSLLGDSSDMVSGAIAQRIAQRFKMQAFVSCQLPQGADDELLPIVERRIFQEIKAHTSQ